MGVQWVRAGLPFEKVTYGGGITPEERRYDERQSVEGVSVE